MLVHATCVSLEGSGVILLGNSGSGKSDLALRLIDAGAALVSDDQVTLENKDAQLIASAPHVLRGLLEARGIGLLQLPYLVEAPITLAVELISREMIERLPEPQFFDCLGVHVPLVSFHAFDPSTPAKIRFAMRHAR